MCKSPVHAQTLFTGELTGVVVDPSGSTIAKANVELLSVDTGVKLAALSGATGDFRFSLLRPGNYSVTARAVGFGSNSLQASVDLGQSSSVRIPLAIQTQQQAVNVAAEASTLQGNNANLATTFSQAQIQTLPDPGGDMTVFAFSAPGVTMSTANGTGNFSVFGLPAISNLFTINGIDVNRSYGNANPAGATSLFLGANEIQEAAVVVNGYLGQYGRLAGANVNYLTKSGTNDYHGNAIWNYNERVLNANDWFNNANRTARPFAVSNAWADSIGGPIRKDRLFFFVDNEGMRYVLPGGGPVYIPTAGFSSFVLNGLNQNNPAAVPLYTKALNLYAGAPGAAQAVPVTAALDPHLGCGGLVNAVYGVSQPCSATYRNTANSLNTEWLLATRIDYARSSTDNFYLRFNTDQGLQATVTDPISSAFNVQTNQPSYSGQFGYTKVLGAHGVNTLVLSARYDSMVSGPPDLTAALQAFPTTFTFNSGLLSPMGGMDFNYPQGRKSRNWQLVDDYSYVRGRHTLKAGVSVRKDWASTYNYGQFSSGQLTFNSFTDFVNGSLVLGSTYGQQFSTAGVENVTYYSAGFYGQDEWRIRPNLMLTLALRLDRESNLRCPIGCFSELIGQGSFDQIAHSATIPYNQSIQTGLTNALGGVDPITPQPRVGMAYRLNQSTVLRGGAGLFADANGAVLYDRFILNAPAAAIFNTTSGLVATGNPNSVFAAVANSFTALQQGFANGATLAQLQAQVPLGFQPPNYFTISKPVRTPKYAEWNFELQHAFGEKYRLSVNYVGNHGFDELVQNVLENGFSKTGAAGFPTTAPDPRFGEIIALNNRGWSNYDGLVSSFKFRMNAQFSGQLSYTWSHALDTCSNDCIPSPFGPASYRFQFSPQSLGLNYSQADYDVRHSLAANYVYAVPTRNWANPILKGFLGGWTAAGTVFFHTGYPFSVVNLPVGGQFGNLSGKVSQPVLADFLGSSSYPSCGAPNVACYSPSLFATPATQHDLGNIPRNSFRGPDYFDTDLTGNKTVAFGEKYRLLVGASFFNILNHPNFAAPVLNVAAGNFGHILSTVSAPTSPYGHAAGSAVSGRVVQTLVKFVF